MKKVTIRALGSLDLKNKEYIIDENDISLKAFLTKYVLENTDQINKFFPPDNIPAAYIIFVNGVIVSDENHLLQNGDKILITSIMGGG
ncbi:MAG: hypothetical protein ACOX4H_00175 [Bacillota bacterium]|jgi:sulfur carrier protein ThiS